MNCTKVNIPSPISINLYFYYSYFALFLSLLITPLQFYVILTKSTNLNAFKWLILNHSFWCLAFEIFFTTVKPFFLAPAIGGFPLGLFRNGTINDTVMATYIGSMIFLTQSFALVTTVINRYLYAFPSKISELINMKYALIGFFVIFAVAVICITVMLRPYFKLDLADAYIAALEYDLCLEIYFHEPAFSFFPMSKSTSLFIFITFLFCCFFLCFTFFVLFFFIFLVFNHKTSTTIAKLQKSLIISAIFQIFLTLIFLFCPIFSVMIVVSFQIPTDSNWALAACCIVASHSFLESFATLYFVLPYRKAVKHIVGYIFPYFNSTIKPIQIPQANNTVLGLIKV